MGEWITLDTHYGPVRAWQATPEGKPRGGLVVIQEIFGANPHIRAVTDDYAAKGYAVLAPSFFDLAESAPDSTEPPELPYDSDGVAAGLAMVDELGVEKALEIVRAAGSGRQGRHRRLLLGRQHRPALRPAPGPALGQLLRGPQREVPG